MNSGGHIPTPVGGRCWVERPYGQHQQTGSLSRLGVPGKEAQADTCHTTVWRHSTKGPSVDQKGGLPQRRSLWVPWFGAPSHQPCDMPGSLAYRLSQVWHCILANKWTFDGIHKWRSHTRAVAFRRAPGGVAPVRWDISGGPCAVWPMLQKQKSWTQMPRRTQMIRESHFWRDLRDCFLTACKRNPSHGHLLLIV